MSGYYEYSMSNNARMAYEDGEKPLSKWTKSNIIEGIAFAIKEYDLEVDSSLIQKLKSLPLVVLKNHLLCNSSWHHTSCRYNETDFYSIDNDMLESLTQKNIDDWAKEKSDTKINEKTYYGNFDYIIWTGSRNYPKANRQHLENVKITEKGHFYYVEHNGEIIKKKIGSNGTFVVNLDEKKKEEQRVKNLLKERFKNSSKNAVNFYKSLDKVEYSYSNHIYPSGRKPTRDDYNNGLENFFKKGEHRLFLNSVTNTLYLETWNGIKWINETDVVKDKQTKTPSRDER